MAPIGGLVCAEFGKKRNLTQRARRKSTESTEAERPASEGGPYKSEEKERWRKKPGRASPAPTKVRGPCEQNSRRREAHRLKPMLQAGLGGAREEGGDFDDGV